MSLTVGELLSRPHLRLELIVGGDLDRAIRWVHASDLPDPAPYLRGDEVVLTTGIWYWHGTASSSFAASLGHVGVAALGFGTNPLVSEVPPELIEACRGWELTLFRVPADVSFIQISEEFVEAQHRLRERQLLESLNRSSQFVGSLQISGGLAGLLRVLWQLLPRPAAVVQRRRGVIACVHEPAGLGEYAAAISGAIAAGAAGGAALGELSVFSIPTAAIDTALVIGGSLEELSVNERTIIDQALAFIAIELQRQHAVEESERRFVGELFDLLVAGEAQLPAVTARLQSLGVAPEARFCAAACIGGDPEKAREAVVAHLAATGRPGAVGVKATAVVLIAQVEPDEDLVAFGQELQKVVGPTFSGGVGGIAQTVGELGRSVIEANHACRFAQRRRDGGFVTHDKLASHALLIGLEDERLLDAFQQTLIEPLREHDRRRHTDLVTTLEMFLGSGGRYQQTAAALHLHVNTLRLRLSRIEQLTGRDLSSMDDRVDLWIALGSRDH
ncbi:MAG: PucR family transcriptional regulator ligand-binding domain-containing protein [Actinomycetota bacterium]|nr:PucR family transcriptional regulator ligand-binding domain-containing protein [Actinomycetota bacterium]